MSTGELILVSKELGVVDLPLPVRRWFARALLAERAGDKLEAYKCLQNALDAETEYRARAA